MGLNNEQISIIAANPLALDHERDRLRGSGDMQDAVSNLLSKLSQSPAIHTWYSSSGGKIKASLLALSLGVAQGVCKLEQFTLLTGLVVYNAPDLLIWRAVLHLVEAIQKPKTPPASLPAANLETPSKTNTNRLDALRKVDGFWEKYLNPKSWQQQQKDMYTRMSYEHGDNGWNFPKQSNEKSIWRWLRKLESRYLTGATNKLSNTKTAYQLKAKGQMDVYFRLGNPGCEFDVLVAGELKESHDSGRFKSDILQLARLARGVFKEQPTRRFVHAFLLCRSTMELWVFDRSGLYSSGEFDIVSDPDKFTRAFVGYATMDNNALGRDVFIKDHRQVTLYDANSTTGGEITISLATEPFFRQNAIVCRGTTCYKTDDDMYVAKFAWAPAKRMLELELLKHAKDKNVRGVVKVVAYRTITSIVEQRAGLKFLRRHPFRDTTVDKDLHRDTLKNTLGCKRKFTGSGNMSSKRPRSSAGQPDLAQSYKTSLQNLETIEEAPLGNQAGDPVDSPAEGSSMPSLPSASIESPSSNQAASLLDSPASMLSFLGTSAENSSSDQTIWGDRIYSCVVVSPAGRVISEFETIKELLESMRDAIRAHQSRYIDGNILHRDISANNIIITKPNTADGFKGMLIDLDLAKLLKNGPTGVPEQTGTMQFMAIEVLKSKSHTYRYNLKSFFYVLL